MNKGYYKKFVCIKDCTANYRNHTTGELYYYKPGQLYGYYHTPSFPTQKNSLYLENKSFSFGNTGVFQGMASSDFIEENFILEKEYETNFKELNQLFETYMAI